MNVDWLTVFGMNVGGVPWTGQDKPELGDGFRNVMYICLIMLVLILACFGFPALYGRIASWWRMRAMNRSWSLNRRSFQKRPNIVQERRGYLRL